MGNFKDLYTNLTRHSTVCAQCGYRFISGDEAMKILQTGDIVHRDCWIDYADDYSDELTEKIDF